jgi:hypothetical protein
MKYINEINILHKSDFRVEQIQEFLKSNDLKVSRSNVYFFINRHINSAAPAAVAVKKQIKEETVASDEVQDTTQRWLKNTIQKVKGK